MAHSLQPSRGVAISADGYQPDESVLGKTGALLGDLGVRAVAAHLLTTHDVTCGDLAIDSRYTELFDKLTGSYPDPKRRYSRIRS